MVTFGVFLFYAAMGNQLKDFVTDSSISVNCAPTLLTDSMPLSANLLDDSA